MLIYDKIIIQQHQQVNIIKTIKDGEKMKNLKVRRALENAKMYQWELAEVLEISEYTLCKRLRKELPDSEQEKLISIIEKNKKEG